MKACVTLASTSNREKWKEHIARRVQEQAALRAYIRETVPDTAVGVCLYKPPAFESDSPLWFLITPGIKQYDRSAWRVSVLDKHGPFTHYTDDQHGRKFETVWDAVLYPMNLYRTSRISEMIVINAGVRQRIVLDPDGVCL